MPTAGRKRRAAPQLMTADRAIMATDRRCSCVSTIILLACLFLSSEMVAANADAEKSRKVPITILVQAGDPSPTAVKMLNTGMTDDPTHMTASVYVLPEAATAADGGGISGQPQVASGTTIAMPAGSASSQPRLPAGDDVDMHKSSLPVAYTDDDAVTLETRDDANSDMDMNHLPMQHQHVTAVVGGVPMVLVAHGDGVRGPAGTYAPDGQVSSATTTTTTTTTTIVVINSTSTSSTSEGAPRTKVSRAAITSPVEAQLPPVPSLTAGPAVATVTEITAVIPGSMVPAAPGAAAQPPTPAPRQLAAPAGIAPAPEKPQAGPVTVPSGQPQPGVVTVTAGPVAEAATKVAAATSGGSKVTGQPVKPAVAMVNTTAAKPAANATSGSKNATAAVSVTQGLQPAFAAPKPSNATAAPTVKLAPPQTMAAIPSAFSNVSAPPPFVFKQKGASKSIRIGCAVPFEGSQKLAGEAVYSALKMAITELAPKVVPDLNINLTCFNSRCSDIPAYAAVTKFADEGAVGVIGEICSRATVAAAGVASMRKIPVISPASTSPSLSQIDYFFRTVPSDRYQGVAAANLVHKAGVRNVAIVYEDSAYGFGLAFNFIAGFTKDGGNVPVVYTFKATQGKPKDAVAKIKAGLSQYKLDGVFISTNNLTFAADFLVEAKAARLDNLKYFGGDAIADYTLILNLKGRPSVLPNLTVTSVAPGSPEFVARFKKFTNQSAYSAFAAHAYDAMDALLRAYKAAAPPKNGTMIIQQLGKQKFAGVGGQVEFDQYGDAVPDNKTYAYLNWNTTTGSVIFRGFISK